MIGDVIAWVVELFVGTGVATGTGKRRERLARGQGKAVGALRVRAGVPVTSDPAIIDVHVTGATLELAVPAVDAAWVMEALGPDQRTEGPPAGHSLPSS